MRLVPGLSLEQRNDVVGLVRALELEGHQFTKYIPYYLGQIILHLQPVELEECWITWRKKPSSRVPK